MTYNINRTQWKTLLDMTSKEQITLVVGDGIIQIKSKGVSLADYLSECLFSYVTENSSEKLQDRSITNKMPLMDWCEHNDLFEDSETGSVGEFINSVLEKLDINDIDYSQLKQLISIKRFNLILSTCSLPLCDIIKELMLENDKKLNFFYGEVTDRSFRITPCNSANESRKQIWSNQKNEILFIDLMGREANSNTHIFFDLNISYDDILVLLFNWIAAINNKMTQSDISTQVNIVKELDNRYLLILGCELPNWLFRFMWFFIKNPTANKENMFINSSIFSHNLEDDSFRKFYNKHKTIVVQPEDNRRFIEDFCKRWEKSNFERPGSENICPSPSPSDLFVSYSHEDREVFEIYLLPLLERLKKDCKVSYWWDRRINGGSEWESDIDYAIKNSKIFMPFVTLKLKEQFEAQSHKYVFQEWRKALKIYRENKELAEMFGRKEDFIIPILLNKECNVRPFAEMSNLFISDDDIYDRLKESVKEILLQKK